jgi:hypothetical protein
VSHSVFCYPQPGKDKSRRVLEAFAAGCGGRLDDSGRLRGDAHVFYGVVGIEHLLEQARAAGDDWYYGDNSFFDATRGTHFRFSHCELQLSRLARPDHQRLKEAGVLVRPWQQGRHIVVVEQSAHHYQIAGAKDWLRSTLMALKHVTDRPIVVRHWNRNKLAAAEGLAKDLVGAHALVTHTSAAANEAIINGIPAFVTGRCAASPVSAGSLAWIETPVYADYRHEWAAGLAGMQWTLDEIRRGQAWRALAG